MIEINFDRNEEFFFEKIKDFSYGHNGMFNSEIFAIYSFYKDLSCNFFIESGIDNGVSTYKLLNLIKDEYFAIDLNSECEATKIFKNNFKFINGDSQIIIENLLNEYNFKKIFISIDGPKGEQAIRMKNNFLKNEYVYAVAIHDTYDGLQNDENYRVFESSSNSEFNDKFFYKLNHSSNEQLTTIYNLKNHSPNLSYFDTFPQGPGISIYSNKNIQIKI